MLEIPRNSFISNVIFSSAPSIFHFLPINNHVIMSEDAHGPSYYHRIATPQSATSGKDASPAPVQDHVAPFRESRRSPSANPQKKNRIVLPIKNKLEPYQFGWFKPLEPETDPDDTILIL